MKKCILTSVLFITSLLSGCLETVNSYKYFSEHLTEPFLRSRWLLQLNAGRTSREQIVQELGQPSVTFENGRIYIYRLIINEWKEGLSDSMYSGYNNAYNLQSSILETAADRRLEQIEKDGFLLVVTDENMEKYQEEIISSMVEFHLVLVFNADGILTRDSLIRIRP